MAPLQELRQGPQVTDGSEKSMLFNKENQVQIVPTVFRQSSSPERYGRAGREAVCVSTALS